MKEGFWREFWKEYRSALAGLFTAAVIFFFIFNIGAKPLNWKVLILVGPIFGIGALVFFILIFESLIKREAKVETNRVEQPNKMKPVVFDESKRIRLTREEIKDIHARGKLTPAEKVKNWEDFDCCPLGDFTAARATPRCIRFRDNCHVCLTDLANTKREWDPMVVHPFVASGIFNDTNE